MTNEVITQSYHRQVKVQFKDIPGQRGDMGFFRREEIQRGKSVQHIFVHVGQIISGNLQHLEPSQVQLADDRAGQVVLLQVQFFQGDWRRLKPGRGETTTAFPA